MAATSDPTSPNNLSIRRYITTILSQPINHHFSSTRTAISKTHSIFLYSECSITSRNLHDQLLHWPNKSCVPCHAMSSITANARKTCTCFPRLWLVIDIVESSTTKWDSAAKTQRNHFQTVERPRSTCLCHELDPIHNDFVPGTS